MTEHYLDNSATTKISKTALDAYIAASEGDFGNPSSLHAMGLRAEKLIDTARAEILAAVGAKSDSIVFTASGSEANNLAIFGRAYAKDRYRRGAKIITTAGEHASVSSPLTRLEAEGYQIVKIPTKDGKIDLDLLKKELTPNVILVTVMLVNNETGAKYDLLSISKIMKAQAPDAVLHADATQAFCKYFFTKASIEADLITLSSHKIHGPKGVGALVIGANIIKNRGLSPIIFGGGQEIGLRSGTENVPGICGFAAAVKEQTATLAAREEKMEGLRNYLLQKLQSNAALSAISPTLPDAHAPHILNLTLPKIKSETMLHWLSSLGVYVSSGSACSSHGVHGESALVAFGRTPAEADCSLRVSFSEDNSEADVDALCEGLATGIEKLAKMR